MADQLLTTKDAVDVLGMSKSWLEKMRCLGPGNGPKYVKVGRAVRYRRSDLDSYLAANTIGSREMPS